MTIWQILFIQKIFYWMVLVVGFNQKATCISYRSLAIDSKNALQKHHQKYLEYTNAINYNNNHWNLMVTKFGQLLFSLDHLLRGNNFCHCCASPKCGLDCAHVLPKRQNINWLDLYFQRKNTHSLLIYHCFFILYFDGAVDQIRTHAVKTLHQTNGRNKWFGKSLDLIIPHLV